MRLKQSRLKQYHHRHVIAKKDNEGSSYLEYETAVPFFAEVWAGGGKIQSEAYGIRLPNIRNLRVDGDYAEITVSPNKVAYQLTDGPVFSVNDGICIDVNEETKPDYKIVAIYPYQHLILEVERI